jgi:hypothetical protein
MFKNLNKILESNVTTSPFPHLVIDNFLDTSTVNDLHNELRLNLSKEKSEQVVQEIETDNQKQYGAYALTQKNLESNPNLKVSSEVNSFFKSKEFMQSLVNKLSGFLEGSTGFDKKNILKEIKQDTLNSEIAFLPPSNSAKRREIHLDDTSVILGFLYYVRLPEDYSFGGSLNLLSREERYLFKSKIGTLACDMLNIYPSDLSIEKTYDYTDNRLIVLCASGYSWHEVSTRRCAITPRITFHGALHNSEKNNLSLYAQNKILGNPLKKKLKHLFKLIK